MDAAGNRIITYEDGLMLHERSTDRIVCLELSGTTRAISPCGRFLAATPQGDQREVVLIDFDDHLPLPADWLENAVEATPASAVEKKTTKSAAKKSATGAAKKQKTPWLKAHRTKLTAIVHSQPCDPDGFYLSAESAWERLAPGKPLPDSLDRAEERERQEYLGLRAPKDLRKVNLATDFWNALVALWSQVEGVGFILDLALEHLKPEAPEISFKYLSFEGQPFYWALRRYLHIATPEQFAEAADRIRAIVESTDAVARVHEGPRRELRDGLAFAFSRDTDWPSRVLQRNADEGGYSSLAGLFALVSVSPDFDLAMAALQNAYPGGTIYTGAFDVIENFGAQAFEILDTPQVRNSYVNKSELESATKLAKKLIGS
ncbi:MAG: hypothetical protein GXP55_13905 [Deltaproteobacteria bacterium]|nr:hypothetical protein [Deltaproteobacteria bacterium]